MKEKIGAINLLRFMAAIGVLLYHYTFMFYQRGFTYTDFGIGRYLFQYGYLGVDLFFIISGFVIALSAEGRSAIQFVISRTARLYPIFWVCVSITSIALLFGGYWIHSTVTFSRYLAGLTMIPGVFGEQAVDGSYWSLGIELRFYFCIFILILLQAFKRIEVLTRISTGILCITALLLPLPLNWYANFLAGIVFYKIYKEGFNWKRLLNILILLPINIYFVISQIADLEAGYKVEFNPWIISLHICIFYLLFLGIALKRIKFANSASLTVAGLLTYPVYLLHQQIGQILFKIAESVQIPLFLSFTGIVIIIFGLSYTVHCVIEERGRIWMIQTLNNVWTRIVTYYNNVSKRFSFVKK